MTYIFVYKRGEIGVSVLAASDDELNASSGLPAQGGMHK